MKLKTVSQALLATLFVLGAAPSRAAMTVDAALTAAKAAVRAAPANAQRMAAVPVEFAMTTAFLPYGSEPIPSVPPSPGLIDAIRVAHAKVGYWTEVSSTLNAARRQIDDRELRVEALTVEPVSQVVRLFGRKMEVQNMAQAAGAILRDAIQDEEMLTMDLAAKSESPSGTIARKVALFRSLGRR